MENYPEALFLVGSHNFPNYGIKYYSSFIGKKKIIFFLHGYANETEFLEKNLKSCFSAMRYHQVSKYKIINGMRIDYSRDRTASCDPMPASWIHQFTERLDIGLENLAVSQQQKG